MSQGGTGGLHAGELRTEATGAVRAHYEAGRHSRHPAIMADAACFVMTQDRRTYSGRCLIDEDVMAEAGVTDLARYAVDPAAALAPDILID